jgi:hypothetical protein
MPNNPEFPSGRPLVNRKPNKRSNLGHYFRRFEYLIWTRNCLFIFRANHALGPPAGGTLKRPKGQILVGGEENNQWISILTFFAAYGSWNSAKMVLSVLLKKGEFRGTDVRGKSCTTYSREWTTLSPSWLSQQINFVK